MLLGAGAKTGPVNSDGQTPLQVGTWQGLWHCMAQLTCTSYAAKVVSLSCQCLCSCIVRTTAVRVLWHCNPCAVLTFDTDMGTQCMST
jgi:hypothetical protein